MHADAATPVFPDPRPFANCLRNSRLIDFHDPRGFHDGRLLLAFRKPLGALAIDVHTAELLAVVVVHGYLPVPVLAPAVTTKPVGAFGFSLGSLFHDGVALIVPGL